MEYAVWGHGPHVLLALHGYGRSHRDFVGFTSAWLDVFTIYSVDLFFHEGSVVKNRSPDKEPWKPEEMHLLFAAFVRQIHTDKVWLLGYSLGGRVAMKLAETMPARIAGLYLFAPDGLRYNSWYSFLSKTSVGRAAFRFLRRHHGAFFKALGLARRAGLVGPGMYRFVVSQTATEEERERVYNVWTFYRLIEPKLPVFAKAVEDGQISVDAFFGRRDKVIPAAVSKKLSEALPTAKVHVPDIGHTMLTAGMGRDVFVNKMLTLPPDTPTG